MSAGCQSKGRVIETLPTPEGGACGPHYSNFYHFVGLVFRCSDANNVMGNNENCICRKLVAVVVDDGGCCSFWVCFLLICFVLLVGVFFFSIFAFILLLLFFVCFFFFFLGGWGGGGGGVTVIYDLPQVITAYLTYIKLEEKPR